MQVEKLPLDLPEDEHILKMWGEDVYRIIVIPEEVGQKGAIIYTIKRL